MDFLVDSVVVYGVLGRWNDSGFLGNLWGEIALWYMGIFDDEFLSFYLVKFLVKYNGVIWLSVAII